MAAHKVSAIVSAYFCEQYLDGRIENLLSQSCDVQIVIVARKSSPEDNIARKWLEKIPDQMVLVNTRGVPTVYAAWNLGIRASDSLYITSANSDDRYLPGGIGVLASSLDKRPKYAIAYSDIQRVDTIGGSPTGHFVWNEGGLKELLDGCFLGPMPLWRRSLHEKYGYFDGEYKVAGDYEFWLRVAAGGDKFFHVREVYGSHLEREDSLEHRSPVRTTWETARARASYRAQE